MTTQGLGEVGAPFGPGLLLRPTAIAPFDRGNGVRTTPYVGKWNSEINQFTTGTTEFAPGTAIPLHTHNVQESVILLAGSGTAQVEDELVPVEQGDAVWVPAGVPHRFLNTGETTMVIYWVYGGRDVTRTIVATGETFEHLSEKDRGATSA